MAEDPWLAGCPAAAPALITDDAVLTYQELRQRSRSTARKLVAGGVKAGAAVGVVVRADLPSVLALHALWSVPAVPVPLDRGLSGPERVAALSVTRASWTWPDPARDAPVPCDAADWTSPPRARTVAAVVLTSGSQGRPDAVLLGWRGVEHVSRATGRRLGLRSADRWLLSLSPAHVGGLAILIRAALLGHAVRIAGAFDTMRFVDLLRAGAFTHASLVPTQALRVVERLEADPPGAGGAPMVRAVLLGGAAPPPTLVRRAWTVGLPVHPTYGMTQTSSQVATADAEIARTAPETVGRPLEGVHVRIDDANGEILVRGPSLAPGTVDGPLALDPDGWYRTGDLGRFDGEGRLHILGRRGLRIISGGSNVDPQEVEHALAAHPAVRDACVVGIPDAEWGERVVAVVVPRQAGLDTAALEPHLRARLHPAKRPREIHVWTEGLPLGRTGKVDRLEVRRRVLAGGAKDDEGAAWD